MHTGKCKAYTAFIAPLVAIASRMASGDENFPVPRIRRERNSRPAMTKGLNDIGDNLENSAGLSRREEFNSQVNLLMVAASHVGLHG